MSWACACRHRGPCRTPRAGGCHGFLVGADRPGRRASATGSGVVTATSGRRSSLRRRDGRRGGRRTRSPAVPVEHVPLDAARRSTPRRWRSRAPRRRRPAVRRAHEEVLQPDARARRGTSRTSGTTGPSRRRRRRPRRSTRRPTGSAPNRCSPHSSGSNVDLVGHPLELGQPADHVEDVVEIVGPASRMMGFTVTPRRRRSTRSALRVRRVGSPAHGRGRGRTPGGVTMIKVTVSVSGWRGHHVRRRLLQGQARGDRQPRARSRSRSTSRRASTASRSWPSATFLRLDGGDAGRDGRPGRRRADGRHRQLHERPAAAPDQRGRRLGRMCRALAGSSRSGLSGRDPETGARARQGHVDSRSRRRSSRRRSAASMYRSTRSNTTCVAGFDSFICPTAWPTK